MGKLAFLVDEPAEADKPAKNPKRRVCKASKILRQPATSTKAQQAHKSKRRLRLPIQDQPYTGWHQKEAFAPRMPSLAA